MQKHMHKWAAVVATLLWKIDLEIVSFSKQWNHLWTFYSLVDSFLSSWIAQLLRHFLPFQLHIFITNSSLFYLSFFLSLSITHLLSLFFSLVVFLSFSHTFTIFLSFFLCSYLCLSLFSLSLSLSHTHTHTNSFSLSYISTLTLSLYLSLSLFLSLNIYIWRVWIAAKYQV